MIFLNYKFMTLWWDKLHRPGLQTYGFVTEQVGHTRDCGWLFICEFVLVAKFGPCKVWSIPLLIVLCAHVFSAAWTICTVPGAVTLRWCKKNWRRIICQQIARPPGIATCSQMTLPTLTCTRISTAVGKSVRFAGWGLVQPYVLFHCRVP